MKPIQILLASIFALLSFNTITAQYGNSGYGNGYGNSYGGTGRINQMNSGMEQEMNKPKETPVEEKVGKIVDNLKSEINLDELQVIAIANILIESFRAQGVLQKQETNQSQKEKDFQALSEITEAKVMVLLNTDQKEKYLTLKEEMKNPKKSKSKKKYK